MVTVYGKFNIKIGTKKEQKLFPEDNCEKDNSETR